MNRAQRIAAAAALLAVVLLAVVGGHRVKAPLTYNVDGNAVFAGSWYMTTDWPRTFLDIIGILSAGGTAVLLLGIRWKAAKKVGSDDITRES